MYIPSFYLEIKGYRPLHKITEEEFEAKVQECKEKGIPYVVNRDYYKHLGEVSRIITVEE